MMYVLYERHSFPVYSEDDSWMADSAWDEKVNLILASKDGYALEKIKAEKEAKFNKVLEARKDYYTRMTEYSPMYPVYVKDSSVQAWRDNREKIRGDFEKKCCEILNELTKNGEVTVDQILDGSRKTYEIGAVPVE